MSRTKDAEITVTSVFDGTKTDRQAFIELILQRQLITHRGQHENNLSNVVKTVDGEKNMEYNEVTPDMRYTQKRGNT